MTWTLIVLILNTVPPRGVEVTGFTNEQECMQELRRFCDGTTTKVFKCRCIPPREIQT